MVVTLKYIFAYAFFLFVMGYGLFIALGAMRNWQGWKRHYKRINLEKYFGDFGRVLWVIVGLICAVTGLFMLMKLSGVGPVTQIVIK